MSEEEKGGQEVPLAPEDRFQSFLRTFQIGEEHVYRRILGQLAVSGQQHIVVDFEDLVAFDRDLARKLIDDPDEYVPIMERAAWRQLKMEDPDYAEKLEKEKALRVRFRKLPDRYSLRKIGSQHLGKMLLVDAIVVRATQVKPMLVSAAFQCKKCHSLTHIPQSGQTMTEPETCGRCRSKLLVFVEKQSTFINSQELRVQERPEDLPPGQLPRAMDVNVTEDLVDSARPGDRISLTGMIKAAQEGGGFKGKAITFDLYIDANYVDVAGKEYEAIELSAEDEKKVISLSKDVWIHRQLIASLAPSIYGYDDIKEAVLYLLFGSPSTVLPDGVTIRGDVNILLIGDPGLAKSQLLQYVAHVAPRGLYTSGRGTTAAGLTAAVVKEKTGGFALEAGALVLADKGVCCIDEMDKMKADDRVAVHEAMEQHTVSIAKGGIVATLNARASVLAAANPALGRYDPYQSITNNIKLPVTLLSRFDLIFVMKDTPSQEGDSKVSGHILGMHQTKALPTAIPIPPDLFRKYVSYAHRIKPIISNEALTIIQNFYLKTRATSANAESPIAITPRQLESLVRLSECRARSFLRNTVTAEDANAVIRLVTIFLQHVGIDTATGKQDIDLIMTGTSKSLRDRMQQVLVIIDRLEGPSRDAVNEETLYNTIVKEVGIPDAQARALIEQLNKDNLLYAPRHGQIKRVSS